MKLQGSKMSRILLITGLALVCAAAAAEVRQGAAPEVKDTREGEDVSLSCRFAPQVAQQNPTYFWLRINTRKHDNVAIGNAPLDTNYRLDFRPEQGRYDLLISNVSYERDNGQFECRVKAPGSGLDLHSQVVALTVLTPPEPPQVSPNARPVATEGKPLQLTCSSAGGSPDPVIKWYKEGSTTELVAPVRPGASRDNPTTATLTVNASRTDDGAAFRCVVWNRAMPDGTRLETTVSLSVNYFPRVEVGPENPVRVERDGTATLQCTVDAKPRVSNVRWTRDGRFVATSFTHTINRVSVQDAGKYMCSADNGLGQHGQAELTLDVLYPPQVSIDAKHREAEEFETVTVHCNVSANPKPSVVEWVREGRPEFRQSGPVLTLPRVTAESAGTYTCRAVNVLDVSTPPKRRVEHIGNASLALLVRHKPGQAYISPDKPVATEGAGVTLSCAAKPAGWPTPQYRWWRDPIDQQPGSGGPVTVLGTGAKYTIQSAHLGSEGTYHCQASNEIGQGEAASVPLEVHQPPRFLAKLQPHVTRKVHDEDFTASCGAHGKPKPSIRWLKDGREIGPGTAASGSYDISTEESESRNSVFTVQSVLKFYGPDRKGSNQLEPSDRGVYTCVFENEVKRAETTMHLRIEHEPIILNRYNKVAYDLREDAQVVCRVQAYPRPEFQWSYGSNAAALLSSSDGHYDISTTSENGDVYTSVLKVSNIRDVDYGEYTCRANNGLGTKRETIKLQPKGPPEHPQAVKATAVGHNFVTLLWEAGFDGGVQNTKYFVSYRRVAGGNGGNPTEGEELASDCYSAAPPSVNADLLVTASEGAGEAGGWQEFDCQKNNPCNVTSLQQHASYVFKVKAYNTKGHSNYSDSVSALTKVDRIPSPQRATYDTDSHSLSVYVAATCLTLDAQVEASLGIVQDLSSGREMEEWHHVDTFHVQASGAAATRKEVIIPSLAGSKQHPEGVYRSSGRSLGDDNYYGSDVPEDDADADHQQITQTEPRVRVRFCLRSNPDTCGDYTEAEIGPSLIREAHILPTPTLIAIVVSCVVFILFFGLLFMFCRCKRHQNKKTGGKNYEMNSSNVGPSMVTQPPPPYYPSSGLENKALEHSLDLALDDATKGHHVYAAQNGYGYHGALPGHQHHGPPPTHGINGGEWVNMGYMENSYSNSNNGGSVNSQDSLWQMKMAAAASNNGSQTGIPSVNDPQSQFQHSHPNLHTHGSTYGYDPLSHGGYGAVDDYAAYPQQPGDMDYAHHLNQGRNSANPSRQEYAPSGDPYAAVQKPRRRMDQHIDSPYHDVSGLPDPYMDQMESDEKQPSHLGMPYDESLESGYSTPNRIVGREKGSPLKTPRKRHFRQLTEEDI